MAFDFRVAIDCTSPHELADWWAEALGWQVEAQDESFIRRMIQAGAASEADTTEHHGALVWTIGAALVSPDPGRPRVLFQLVPERKTVKNRLHLDVRARRPGGQRVLRGLSVLRDLDAGAAQLAAPSSRSSLRSATVRPASTRARSRRGLRSVPR
jgi:hypothetical protein